MNVVVLGANGQLGSDMMRACTDRRWTVTGLTHDDVRVEDLASVRAALHPLQPDAIINTAAFHHVPKCEEDPDRAFRVNARGALHVAHVAAETGATQVYISTDYVFDGVKAAPYVETDLPHPLNVYAGTKLLGEHFALTYAPRAIALRVSGIYGEVPCRAKGGNFITTMIRAARERPEVRVVTDEVLTPTPTTEIARAALDILAGGGNGLYHLTCEGSCSWYEFARVIFDTLGLSTPLIPVSVADNPSPVRRPTYSVLENARVKEEGITSLPHWRAAVVQFLNRQSPSAR